MQIVDALPGNAPAFARGTMDAVGKPGLSCRVTLAGRPRQARGPRRYRRDQGRSAPVAHWRVPMTAPQPVPEVADEVPWSDGITEYDNQHDETYIRLLDADEEGVGKDEMARLILGIDPRQGSRSGLARPSTATWHAPAG